MSQPVRATSPDKDLDVAPELIPLLRLVTRAEGFALAFLECNVPVEAERIVAELSEALELQGRHCRTLRMSEPEEDLLGRIRSICPPMAPGEALFVLGFERAIPSRVEFPPALTRLNRDRERFRELPFPVVLALPRYALDQLSRDAPDFWAWRSGVFEVRVEEVYLEQMRRDAVEPELTFFENLSASRKQDHLEVLQELLAELEAQGKGNESEKADLYQRIALLHLAMDRWSESELAATKALELASRAGDRAKVAANCQQLGRVAQSRGTYEEALKWYQKSLQITEELGNRTGMASSYHQLGMLAELRGSNEEALKWYRKSRQIFEEQGDRAGMARAVHHQMGIGLQHSGPYEEALKWYRKSLEIFEKQGHRVGMARTYYRLGRVAQKYGSYQEALKWYRKSLEIFEELGNRAGTALSLSQIGVVFTERGTPEEAVPLNLQSLAIRLDLQLSEIQMDLHWLGRQRELLGDDRFREIVTEHTGEERAVAVLEMLDRESEN